MSTPVPPTHVYKASDPPQLHQTSMEALREYFMRLDYYNRRVARVPVTSDHDKIEGAGMGLQVLALKTWFSQGLSKHLAKPYAQFKSELIRRAVPADFVWTQLEVLHRQRQVTGHDVHAFQDFSDRMRVLQMEIGFQVVSDQELAKLVLLGTDPELCRLLRTHVVSDAPAEQPGEFDYQVFERIGREEWGVIAQRRAAIATQVAALLQQRPNTRPTAFATATM
ncbi:BZ3500_MvSof-1268-A1-R1_Chr9g10574 [Microbotryum saponariae]|uniref:BZ3500_MvSof-1268-A1-R1_Chr9g10574 protein n=1 Tax=Microbotryum saponariae TaxID=289078 RepID=A0A2X0L1A8_9BASI|nr:BZ3500_MvSof-1268-A1-R1_Chr9g10574 [Microbotryum saponariae]